MRTVKSVLDAAVVAASLVTMIATPAAKAADMPSHDDGARSGHHRHASVSARSRQDVVVAAPKILGMGSNDPEHYERPLYQGPAFLYRPYYGSGPSLQLFDFGLGRDRNGFE